MTQEKIARTNELTRLSRERALTKEEEEESKLLHQAYIEEKVSARQKRVDNTLVEYADGTCITLEESAKNHDKSAAPNGTV